MTISFRHLPFDENQQRELSAIVQGAGFIPRWFSDDDPITPETLADSVALVGYFPPEIFPCVPALRWVQLPCAGAERFCKDASACPGLTLTNCAGAFGVAIAEYMVMGLMMLLRSMPAYMDQQRARIWKALAPCRTIAGSTVTIVGMGGIGGELARLLKGLGATVRGVRRHAGSCPEYFDAVYTVDQLRQAVQGVDAVALCIPATPESRGLISREVLAAMRPGTLLLNCGRGAVVDEAALIDALRMGHIGGAALDVTQTEPLPADSALWTLPNVVITPHVSGRDVDPVNIPEIFRIVRDNLARFVANQPLTHVVDCRAGY